MAQLRILLAGFLVWGSLAAQTIHLIELRHRPAGEIAPLVQPLLKPGESVSGTGYQLLLNASDARRNEIEKMVRALDTAQRQLTIAVRQVIHRNGDDARISTDGTIVVGRGDIDADVRIRANQRTSTGSRQTTQQLRVQDGQHGFIRIGQSIPSVERIIEITGRGHIIAREQIAFRQFATGFDVLPRVRGNTVLLEITPRLAGGVNDTDPLRFQELSTTVSVRLGEWINLGEVANDSAGVSREILGSAKHHADERLSVFLRVDER